MLSARRSPLAVVLALVATVACVLFPGTALAAVALLGEPMVLGEPMDGEGEGFSWEPVASTCDADVPVALPPEPMCEIVAVDPDEDGFFAAAPLCDPSGASVIAAEPVHPIGDDRIEATPSCDDDTGSWLRLDRRSGPDDPAQRVQVAVDPALLPILPVLPRFWSTTGDVGPSRLLGPAEGVRPRLEHPPHGA